MWASWGGMFLILWLVPFSLAPGAGQRSNWYRLAILSTSGLTEGMIVAKIEDNKANPVKASLVRAMCGIFS